MTIAISVVLAAVFGLLALKAPRGNGTGERRREKRYPIGESCMVSILGQEESHTTCTLINVSRSGIRIAVDPAFPINAQINVEWGTTYFVGTVCNSEIKEQRRILGLRLVATNCR